MRNLDYKKKSKETLICEIERQYLYQKINRWYEKKKIWTFDNYSCKACMNSCDGTQRFIVGPLLPSHIGEEYHKLPEESRILFVGKATESHKFKSHNKIGCMGWSIGNFNPRFYNEIEECLPKRSPFWNFIANVAERVYKENINENAPLGNWESIKYVAATNLVKCGAGYKGSKRVDVRFVLTELAQNCLYNFDKRKDWGILDQEIKILNPRVIVFLTSSYDNDIVQSKYFPKKLRRDIKSQAVNDEYYWVINKEGRIYIAAWHPQGKGQKYCEELVGLITKYSN